MASVVQGFRGSINDDPLGGVISDSFPYPAFEFLGKNNALFSALFGYFEFGQLNVKVRGEADLGSGEAVSGDYFKALDAAPAAGRLIMDDDDRGRSTPGRGGELRFSQKRFGEIHRKPSAPRSRWTMFCLPS